MDIKIVKSSGIKANHRLENKPGLDSVYKIFDMDFDCLVECRVYFTAQFNATACLWVHCGGHDISGSYKTSGTGFNKRANAISGAIYEAGFRLNPDTSDYGEEGAVSALEAIAKKLSGKRKVKTIHSHG